jgi:hypothetical protein
MSDLEITVPPEGSAFVEWHAFRSPRTAEAMGQASERTIVLVGETVTLDSHEDRVLLVGWNYGPAPVQLIFAANGTSAGDPVPANREFVVAGFGHGSIAASTT